jgi:amino acid adenylation domain-containing protein
MRHDPFLLHHLLARAVDEFPVRTAVVSNGQRFTYADIMRSASGLAGSLRAHGIVPGDRVVSMLDNGVEAVVALFGTLLAGCVAVPLNSQVRAGKLEFVLRDTEAAVLIANLDLAERLAPALERTSLRYTAFVPRRDVEAVAVGTLDFWAACASAHSPLLETRIDADLAMLIYTSGSTGTPKAVMLSHLNMLSAARSIQAYLEYMPDDVILCALPMSFDYGLYQVLLAASVGATVVFDGALRFPGRLLQILESERVSVLPGVPTLFSTLLYMPSLSKLNRGSLRLLTNTGAALSERMIRELRTAFPRAQLFSMYGLTECKRVSFLPPEQLDARPTSVGRGMPNQDLWLVDEAGRRLPNGATGELVVSGNHVMIGYWRRPEETDACLLRDPERNARALRTGDIFRTDDEGYLYFVGRTDDIIKCRGQKVSPREVENVILELTGIAEAAVFGVRDAYHGEIVQACVALRAGCSYVVEDIMSHCLERLENYMVPAEVEIKQQLPRNENGKIDKVKLASEAELSHAGAREPSQVHVR